jgi:hypothetical protein
MNAGDGDTILVGPGRYGDLNGNGVFAEAGEEGGAPGGCVVCINKRLTVMSRQGALSTVLDAGGTSDAVVRITASHAAFGAPSKGFTVTGSQTRGVEVQADQDTWIMGNVAQATGAGFMVLGGSGHRLIGNVSTTNGNGFFLVGDDMEIKGNVAFANAEGFTTEGNHNRFEENSAVGNRWNGFLVAGTAPVWCRNSAIGNGLAGFHVTNPGQPGSVSSDVRIEHNNIYGNNTLFNGPFPNSGMINSSDTLVIATDNYWGGPTGPGADPADAVFNYGASVTVTEPFAVREFKIP